MCTTSYMKTQKLLNFMAWNTMYTQIRIFFFLPQKGSTYQKPGGDTFDASRCWRFSLCCNSGCEDHVHLHSKFQILAKLEITEATATVDFFPYHHFKNTFPLFLVTNVIEVKISKPIIRLNLPRWQPICRSHYLFLIITVQK